MKHVTRLAIAVALIVAATPTWAKKADKPHALKGCLEATPDSHTFQLISTGKKHKAIGDIVDQAHGVDLTHAVGHVVTVSGTEVIFKPGDRTIISTKKHPLIRAEAITAVGRTCS